MPQVPLSWAAVPRLAALIPLACAASLAAIPSVRAQNPVPATTIVNEATHTVEVEVERDGATLRVTRTLFNPTLLHARVDLPIPLPCEALLDEFQVEELAAGGSTRWKPAELLSPSEGDARFDAYFDSTLDTTLKHVVDSDSAMLLTRAGWSCQASLSIYPIPPVSQRSFSYRVWIPSVYVDGRYTIELPSFDGYGLTPSLELSGFDDDALLASVDQQELDGGTSLDGSRAHTIVLSPRDPSRGRVRTVDLDVDALVHRTPAATGLLAADAGPLPRVLATELEAPAELASLPRVRRAVVLIDASRSVSADKREQMQRFAAAYFEALAEHDAKIEVLLFDREVRRVYHSFVPADWGARDLTRLEIDDRNGSEVGVAMAAARELLAEPTKANGADWIIVLSDLTLRSDFDVAAEQAAAEASAVRVHVVREVGYGGFAPAASDDPWTVLARASGGMAWEDWGATEFADELVSPKRIWNLGLELDLADGSHRSEELDRWFGAGGLREWSDTEHEGAALTRAAFVGEVWGQRRAWSSTPSEIEGRRTAGALATNTRSNDLSDAVLTALAFHAQVVTEYSSAWALAEFGGTAPELLTGYGIGFGGSGGHGCSISCGGAHGCRHPGIATPIDFASLAQQALDKCKTTSTGAYSFETTDLEIVDVTAGDRCLAEQTWLTDITPTSSYGRKVVVVDYVNGQVKDALVLDR